LSPKALLLVPLAATALVFAAFWAWHFMRARASGRRDDPATNAGAPSLFQLAIGAVTNFFDTLGVSSFATTTSIFRFSKMVPDRLLPGTLNVGHAFPTFVQAAVYTQIIEVDLTTLVLMIAASVAGAWLGAGVVARLPKQKIQLGMGIAMIAACALFVARVVQILPAGGNAVALSGGLLVVGLVGNFIFGALMTIGIGAYAPIMILVSMLGMEQTTAFPIMMGSCAFLMPVASAQFVRLGAYALRPALGLALGGMPAVLAAAFIVKSMSLDTVRILVVIVVGYTAITLLRAAARDQVAGASENASENAAGPA
jgi:uncharacterized membrane protein YfcA